MSFFATFVADLRFAMRMLVKTPSFTLVAVGVLALGIGLNTAMFSVVHELAFSARPFAEPERVVQLYTKDSARPDSYRIFAYPAFEALKARTEVFSGVLAHNLTMVGVGNGVETTRALSALVSDNYFDVLGVPLARGRRFTEAEGRPGAGIPVAIASHALWQRLGQRADFVGSTLIVNERPFTIVGITPEHFTGTIALFGPELYFPLGVADSLSNDFQLESRAALGAENAYELFLVARLQPGVGREAADAALRSVSEGLAQAHPGEYANKVFTLGDLPRLSTSSAPQDEREVSTLALLLIGMTSLVLLIACLNLANMLLARGSARRKEIAVRLALGGGRARIIRQLVTEGFLLSLAGGVVGFVLAAWAARLLVTSLGTMAPVTLDVRGASNPAVLAATIGFCAFATLCFALGPAVTLSRPSVMADLKAQAGDEAASARRWGWLPRNPLVLGQVALSLALLVAAGLFMRGAFAAAHVRTGLRDADSTLIMEADASLGGYDEARSRQVYQRVSQDLAAVPGVQAASIAATVPYGFVTLGRAVQRGGVHVAKGARPSSPADGLAINARWNSVGADYFAAFGVPLLRGRAFTTAEADQAGAPRVAIIDEALARKLWPDGDALGQRIQFADPDADAIGSAGAGTVSASQDVRARPDAVTTIEVVGIAATIRASLNAHDDSAAVYVPFAQGFVSNVQFHVRTAGAPTSETIGAVRRAMQAAAPGVPLFKVRTFRQHLEGSADYWAVQMGATMFSVFGGLALVLTMAGVYGVKAYAVARRTREIGIRMALGAEPRRLQAMILREGLVMALAGIGLGLVLGAGLARVLARLLYEVSPLDPVTFAIAPVLLLAAVLAACWIPARRATRVPPLTALRAD